MIINKIAYVYSDNLRNHCNRLPTMKNRASMVQDLIDSYKILQTNNNKLTVIESLDATEDELKLFHSSSYIDFLKRVNDIENEGDEELEFGLGYDCPILAKNFDFVKSIAGGSLTGAKLLAAKKCEIAINWFGGWHHARRDAAEGFCYVNDIVIAIQKLTETYDKILYLDLDIHHGDGVQDAFELSKKILTLSLHKLAPGFYPGTGTLDDIGLLKGKYHTINVPLGEGVNDRSYLKVFNDIFPRVFSAFKPQVMVVQCGADSLNGDEIGGTNLTLRGVGKCIENVLSCKVPVLFLGGGGYNSANTSRLWAYLTSIIVGQELEDDIPDSSEFFTKYGPTYELHIDESNRKDCNTNEQIDYIVTVVSSYCKLIE